MRASRAGVTQLAECLLPKQNVAGWNSVSRSTRLTPRGARPPAAPGFGTRPAGARLLNVGRVRQAATSRGEATPGGSRGEDPNSSAEDEAVDWVEEVPVDETGDPFRFEEGGLDKPAFACGRRTSYWSHARPGTLISARSRSRPAGGLPRHRRSRGRLRPEAGLGRVGRAASHAPDDSIQRVPECRHRTFGRASCPTADVLDLREYRPAGDAGRLAAGARRSCPRSS